VRQSNSSSRKAAADGKPPFGRSFFSLIAAEPCLEPQLEALILVWSGPVGVEKLVVQAFLGPGREGAVDERGLDEKVDAVTRAVDDKRRRSELEDRESKLERESVAHLDRRCGASGRESRG
jgi:hypothetical protein